MNAADTVSAARKLVVLGNDRSRDPLWAYAARHPDPRRIDIFHSSGAGGTRFPEKGAYLCAEMQCSPPVTTDGELEILLKEGI
jgi:uncharacterized protein YyaL (SSP411 family)